MTRCVKCEPIETYYGFIICREEDNKVDFITEEPYGRSTVFYTVNDDDCMLESFKTLREAKSGLKNFFDISSRGFRKNCSYVN